MKVRLFLTVLAVLSCITYSRSTCAQGQTSGNFYYPTGSINFRISTRWLAADCDGSGKYITIDGDPKYHVGVDIVPNDIDKVDGSSIYAISDGLVIYRSDKPTSGWGVGNIALVIKHELSNGQPFFAVYGHIRSNLNEGDLVYAGKSFATIGSLFDEEGRSNHHLHFGINLGHINPSGELVEPRTNLGLMSCKYWPNKNDFENPISWIETQKAPSAVHTLDKQTTQEIKTKRITPLRQSSVYTAKNSRTYHRYNCSELNTSDLIEFSSPQEAESSGAIPCKNCNQLAVGIKDESNQKTQSNDQEHGKRSFFNLTRETATEILKNSKYFPRYRILNLPIGKSVNVEGLIKSAMAVNYEMGQELSVGYGCAKRLGHLSFVGKKRNIFGTQFAPLYNVSVTREGMKHGNVINSEAFGYRQQYAYHIYRTSVYKVTGIRHINQSSSEVEFIYRADNIGQLAKCVHPNITPDRTESVGQAMFKLFDDGWRVDTVKAKGQYTE